jgi:peptide/nickel transport system ATP-binding protein
MNKTSKGDSLLSIEQLAVDFETPEGLSRAVNNVSLELKRGEVLGIVGESGSGKSTTVMSVIGLLPQGARRSGKILLDGQETSTMSDEELRVLRGKIVGTIFQDPLSSLNPLMKIGKQIIEAIRVHNPEKSKKECREIAIDLLNRVGIVDPEKRMNVYPHELSGGMRQRVVIAQAISNRPALLIADEPTTALDVTTQVQVLKTLEEVRSSVNAAMILISHNLGVIADSANRVAVMYNGRLVEVGLKDEVLGNPQHPYTIGLLKSRPTLDTKRGELESIPGVPPRGTLVTTGCPFAPRCERKGNHTVCDSVFPDLLFTEPGGTHQVACHFAGPMEKTEKKNPSKLIEEQNKSTQEKILVIKDLIKEYPLGRGKKAEKVIAVNKVSFTINRGETLAVVGESGCGKTTLARSLLRLIEPTDGKVYLGSTDVRALSRNQLRQFRTQAQIVFQDPTSSLNPRRTVGELIAEPMIHQGLISRSEKQEKVEELLKMVSLFPEHANRYPSELSGGQRQRVSIARALGLQPDLLVLDEPVSAVDVSVQAQLLELFTELQKKLNIGYLFISHDLGVVKQLADKIIVMYRGRVAEQGLATEVLADPRHPYTQLLVASVPGNKLKNPEIFEIESGIASVEKGCLFANRCPLADASCTERVPLLEEVESEHFASCHKLEQARNRFLRGTK